MKTLHYLKHFLIPHESNNQRAKLLHPSTLGVVIGLFVVFQFFLTKTTYVFPQILGYASQIPATEIIRLTNLERSSRGLPELKLDTQLSTAASRKASDMFARNYWAHVSPIGTQPWFFITESGYPYRYAGENLARDFSDPSSVVRAWIASPAHKDNLLSNRYQDIGVAVVDGKLGGQETTLVVQMFSTKLAAVAPPVAKSVLDISVQAAAEEQIVPTATPVPVVASAQTLPVAKVSPFGLTKALSVMIVVFIVGVLTIDVVLVARHKIVRWTSRSVAHLAFMLFLLISAIIIYRGQIM